MSKIKISKTENQNNLRRFHTSFCDLKLIETLMMFLKTTKPHPYTTCIKLPKLLVYQYTHQRSLACPKDFETSLSYILNWRSENINFNIDSKSTKRYLQNNF